MANSTGPHLNDNHCACLNRVLELGAGTQQLIDDCAYCFEGNQQLSDHLEGLRAQNNGMVEQATRLKAKFFPNTN